MATYEGCDVLSGSAHRYGRENNSADEHTADPLAYPGDGIDTRFADLLGLEVSSTNTAIHAVGVGYNVAESDLTTLATLATGGTYTQISDYSDLMTALSDVATMLEDELPVCFGVSACDQTEAQITITLAHADGSVDEHQSTVGLPDLCPMTQCRHSTLTSMAMANPSTRDRT